MMEPDAAPAGGDGRTPAPGRPGTPTGGHYDPSARSSLDWDWRKPRPRKRGPGACVSGEGWGREPPWSAERRPHPWQQERGKTEDWCAAWRSTPSALPEGKRRPRERGRDYGVPGAAKNTGDDVWLFEN